MTACPLDPWELRLDLAIRGWHSEVRLTRDGIGSADPGVVSFGVWARCHHWQGRCADICLHEHKTIDLNREDALHLMARRIGIVHEACLRATRDFPDAIPCLNGRNPDGTLGLAENDWEMRQAKAPDPDLVPTEALPESAKGHGDGGSHLEALREAALAGLHLEDAVSSFFGRPRHARDCKDREWGYRLRVAVRSSAEDAVVFKPQEFTTRILQESVVAPMIATSSRSLLSLFADHAPGGRKAGTTGNRLPPGFQLLADWIVEQERRRTAEVDDPEI
ncbi:hypothetical protein LAZ40_05530 [Cereibacter sphaeroides]|uniref:hypothetical protein n=1 Tax=Cereibacter sphaeroides TaxID=1063 RepID=UPI001F21002E|nr:hypothetical protein [Cereibacter sphaeroides]MCE6958510.1 hypothetical protein [Cereibacter sphaeroides]MCE6972828.1 hypothetical protein [Cereibacter sphaeroides]